MWGKIAQRVRMGLGLALGLVAAGAWQALASDQFTQTLSKLDPEERSHQACIIRGFDAVRADPRLRKADRMKTSILTPAVLKGATLTAKGAAVRAANHWYALSFVCSLTPDLMKATTFSFTLGPEIPKQKWNELGLWG